MDTRQRPAAPSDIRGVAGCSTNLVRSPFIWAVAAVDCFQPSESFPSPGHNSWTTSVLTEMRDLFPEGVHRFLLVAMRGLYLAELPRL